MKNIAREITGKSRNRLFVYDQYLAVINQGTEVPWLMTAPDSTKLGCRVVGARWRRYGPTSSLWSVNAWPLEEADVTLARRLHDQHPTLGARDLCS